MNYDEAYSWLIGTMRHGSRAGIERMRDILAYLDHPERKLRYVHIAGTNGKGSVSAYTASVLAAANYKVGMFISPYLERFGERIRILDGRADLQALEHDPSVGEFRAEDLIRWCSVLKQAVETLEISETHHPTHFELLTLMAFLHFAAERCDIVVLETGLGGTLDATNIIPAADVHIITTVSYDHEAVLGNSIRAIAENKAGIIKAPTPVILYDPADGVLNAQETATVLEVVRSRCTGIGAPLEVISSAEVETLRRAVDRQTFLHRPSGMELTTYLAADFQTENAALALAATRYLIPAADYPAAARYGIERTRWPGRFELIGRDPLFLIDGAHNPESAAALVRNLRQLLPRRKLYTVLGLLADKDCDTILRLYFEHPALIPVKCLCLTPDSPRALPAESLAERIRALRPDADVIAGETDDLASFVEEARAEGAVVAAWGSFYLIGPLKTRFLQGYNEAAIKEKEHEIS